MFEIRIQLALQDNRKPTRAFRIHVLRLHAKRSALDALTVKRAKKPDSGDAREGYDTNNDTKTTQGSGPPPVPSARIAEPPVRQRGKAAPFRLDSQIPDLRNVSCKLIPEQRRQAVEEVGIRGLTAPYQILHFHFQRNCDPVQHP